MYTYGIYYVHVESWIWGDTMRRMIIADDEEIIRQGLLTVEWETIGVEVAAVCKNGHETLQLTRELQPDIVLTDIRMPGMDGIAIAEAVRNELPQAKVILLTAYHDFEYAHAAILLGVAGFVLKPASAQEILQAVSATVQAIETESQQSSKKQRMEKLLKEYRLLLQDKLLTKQPETELSEAVEAAMAFIEQRYMDDISIADMAECVHLHPVYLSRLVKKETGETLHDMLTRTRMRHAFSYIADPNMKLYEIAEKVGIPDVRYFGQIFKKCFGLTPSALRQQLEAERHAGKKEFDA